MAGADRVRELREAPGSKDSHQCNSETNIVIESVSYLRDVMDETNISTDYESAYGATTYNSESSGEERRTAREKRKARAKDVKEEEHHGRSKSRDRRWDEPREKNKCPL